MINIQHIVTFLKSNGVLFIIFAVAAWLRVWQLDTHGILFSDSGHDLLVAQQAVADKSLPLLGIPSSVPRFKQGPISIWIEMLVISIFGTNTYVLSITFAVLSSVAVIGIYEFTCIYIGKKQGVIAAALLATAPLAVANGRVPYHTTPLPLALVLYLFSIQLLWEHKKYSFFLSTLAFAFLFQFELAMAPLFLLIPFTIWWQKIGLNKNNFLQLSGGIVLGLLPQIIFDLTHKFAQIGVFFLWIGHKLYEFVSFKDGGSVHFENYFVSFLKYGGRIFSTDYSIVSTVMLLVILYGLYVAFSQFKKKKINSAVMIVELSLILLIGGYFIHGSPSEAYFPPFFILLPIHIAWTIFTLPKKILQTFLGLIAILFIFNCISIVKYNFFVDNTDSFSYGASTAEIRESLTFITTKSNGSYDLKTLSSSGEVFPSHFDNFKWTALELNYSLPTENSKKFYVEPIKSAPIKTPFLSRDFKSLRVYWSIQ